MQTLTDIIKEMEFERKATEYLEGVDDFRKGVIQTINELLPKLKAISEVKDASTSEGDLPLNTAHPSTSESSQPPMRLREVIEEMEDTWDNARIEGFHNNFYKGIKEVIEIFLPKLKSISEPNREYFKDFVSFLLKDRVFFVDEVRNWLRQYDKEEISFSKFVELFNEKVFNKYHGQLKSITDEPEERWPKNQPEIPEGKTFNSKNGEWETPQSQPIDSPDAGYSGVIKYLRKASDLIEGFGEKENK